MKLTVFGNNATCPEAQGACASFLVETEGKRILLDMGSASLAQLQRWHDLKNLDLIVLSHLHFDHFGDLFCAKYQLETRAALGEAMPTIGLLSPKLPPWAETELLSGNVFSHQAVNDGFCYTLGGVTLRFVQVTHLVESYAVQLFAENKTLVYSGDSGLCPALEAAAQGANCFLCEATLVQGQQAEEGHHLAAASAGQISARANAKALLLTHYHSWQADAVLAQAQAEFVGAQLTHIGECYEI